MSFFWQISESRFSYRFTPLHPHWWSRILYWWSRTLENVCFCYVGLQVTFLMISGSASGCLGLQNQTFGVSCKKNRCCDFVNSGVFFTWWLIALGQILKIFGALETGLKCDDFSKWFWDHFRSFDPPGWG